MKTLAKIAVLAAATMALAPTAHAAPNEEQLAQLRSRFEASDKNKDGKLTQQEARDGGMSRVASNFGRLDADKDGYVTLAQLETQTAARSK